MRSLNTAIAILAGTGANAAPGAQQVVERPAWQVYPDVIFEYLRNSILAQHLALELLSLAAVCGLVCLLHRSGDKPAQRAGNKRMLRVSWLNRLLALFSAMLAALAVYTASGGPLWKECLAWPVALGLWLAAGWCLYHAFCVRIGFNDHMLAHESALAGRTKMPYREIMQVDLLRWRRGLVVKSMDGRRIRVSSTLEGFEELGNMLELKTPHHSA